MPARSRIAVRSLRRTCRLCLARQARAPLLAVRARYPARVCEAMIARVAILFARSDSVYKSIEGCDVWDEKRDALQYPGGLPVVAHPPCRLWSRLAPFAKAPPEEKRLAIFALEQARQNGGVVEHPYGSKLWKEADLSGGWMLDAPQFWWGHKAEKPTRFFIVGCNPRDVPPIPLVLGDPTHQVGFTRNRRHDRLYLSRPARERTPPDMARWLVGLAMRCIKRQEAA